MDFVTIVPEEKYTIRIDDVAMEGFTIESTWEGCNKYVRGEDWILVNMQSWEAIRWSPQFGARLQMLKEVSKKPPPTSPFLSEFVQKAGSMLSKPEGHDDGN